MANHWLMKSELDVYPWSQLLADGWTHWDGVRNYQARNMMDDMKVGDLQCSKNCKPPHIAGIARVKREGYPDFTSWDPTRSTTTRNLLPITRDGSWLILNQL